MLAQSLFYTRAVPEVQGDEILKFWELTHVVGFFGGKFSVKIPQEK